MKRYLLVLFLFAILFRAPAGAQGNQVLNNGANTTAVNFSGCIYNWTNNAPGIGLAASGSGNINQFTAVNTGQTPVIATIMATPVPVVNAYIPNSDNPGTVTVVNTATNMVTATINVGGAPLAVAASPDGSMVYTANSMTNNVSVINTATNNVVATIPVGNLPNQLAVSYDGLKVFVGNVNDGTVSVISTVSNMVIATIPGFTQPFGLAAGTTGNLLYVTNQGNTISVINTVSNTIVKTIIVGDDPWQIAVNAAGTRVYVTNLVDNTVSVIDAVSNTVIATIPVDLTPEGVAVSPDGTLLYVGCFNNGEVTVINTGNNTVVKKLTAIQPHGLSVTPDGKLLYVVNNTLPGSVTAFNEATGAIIAAVPVGNYPSGFGNFIATVSCSPVKFTITVNPTPASQPTISAGPATGTISACAGTASVSPQVQQIKVSGSALTGNMTATAPAGFEISLSAGSGYGSSIILSAVAGAVNAVVYVRSAATAAAGTITGDVTLTAAGASAQNVAVTGFVNALPAVNNVTDQYINTGSPSTAVSFAGTGNTFNWTNDTPGIGLAAAGTGDIASFTAVNTGSNPVTATITATPVNANYAYVPDAFSNDVLLINTGTNTVVNTIAVGKYPTNIVLIQKKNVAYVSNSNDNTVSEINTLTNNVIATIPGFSYPWGLVASPDGNKLYVVNVNSESISVINTATNAIVSTIPLTVKPYLLTISPDGSQLYLTNEYAGNVSVISTATNAITATIAVGNQPENMALNADGSLLYVANTVSLNISVINTKTNAVIATIPTSERIFNLLVSPDGSKLYMIGSDFLVVNTATYQTTATVALTPSFSYGMSITADGRLVYVANTSYATVSVVDTNTDAVIATINAGIYPIAEGGFVTQNATCPGPPVKFNITVYPAPAGSASITPGTATGAISACAGTPSASPQIQQVPVSGSSLTGNITATVSAGFEISLSAGSGYGSTLTLTDAAGAVNTVVYVRSAATAAVGNINGIVTLTAAGATTQYMAVNGVVNALPVVNTVANQAVNNGAGTAPLNFTGTGNAFTWTNDTPSIGLAGAGAGDIPSFAAINNGANPVIATITVTPEQLGFAYITNFGSNNVSVLSTANNSVVATIPVGAGPWGVGVSPDGSRAYITNITAGTVSVINTGTNLVIATITVGLNPGGVCVSPDGSRVYVSNLNNASVSVIDAAANSVVSTITGLSAPNGIVLSPDGSKLYVVNSGTNSILVINTVNNNVIATVSAGSGGTGIAISPDGSRVYVANDNSNNVTVINTATNTVAATVQAGINPFAVVVSPDGSRAYVTNENDSNITVINTATNTVSSNINLGPGFSGISITSDGNDIFAVDGSDIVEDISVSNNAVKATYSVGTHPIGFGNFITKNGCPGMPAKATITVNPGATAPPVITANAATGSISACQGTPSANPLIQEIIIIGSDLTGDITATAPPGFEVSVNQNGGYSSSATLAQFGGAIGSGVFVRSSATAPAGNISGNVTLTSPGATTQNVAVAGIINALPVVNKISNQTFTAGNLTTGVTFSGQANNFKWVNDTPAIGLAASGNGNITPFTAINNGSSPVIANITVTPINSGAAYVPGYASGTLSIINTSSNTVEGTVSVGSDPVAVAISPDGSKVFVANNGDVTISVIDVASNTLITTIPFGTQPNSLTITPDGKTIYVANYSSNTVSVIDASNYQVTTDIIVGLGDFGIVASPDSKFVYVANTSGNSVSVISTATNTVVATIAVANGPRDVAVSPDGGKLYVTNFGSNTVTVISTATNAVTAIITVGTQPDGVAVSDDGKLVYVTNNGSGTVSVINAATGAVTATIPVGSGPSGVSFTTGGSYAYVTNQNDNSVSVISTATNKVISTVSVGTAPISFGNFIAPSNGCPGVPFTLTITVNPSATAPIITAGPQTGTISACAGTASVSPQIQQFTVSGSNLGGNISASVPSGFEISTSPTSGFSGAVTLQQTGGTVNSTTLYVRSSASAPVGTASGYVTLSSVGWQPQGPGVPIAETINALPAVNPVSNQSVNNGASAAAVSFSGTGNSFTWTNDTPAIGLPASGTGDIAPFTATNTGSSAVVATITATPVNGGFAYLTRDDGTVAVVNTTTGQVVSAITAGNIPAGVTMAPGGGLAFIANLGSNTISVINTTTNKVTRTIPVSGGGPIGLAASHNGKWLYVADENSGLVSVINTASGTEVATIPVGSNPYGIAVSPDDSRVYVTNFTSGIGGVSVINTATNTVIATITVELSPVGIVVSPDGTRLYVANQISGSVSVIDAATYADFKDINVGKGATGITISPDGSRVYVSNSNENTVSVINTATNSEVLKIAVGSTPFGISTNADGSLVYVANTISQNLSVINTATNTVVNTISTGDLSQSFGNFIKNGSGCAGGPVKFTITVNPLPGALPAITATAATGSISACAGTASVSPQLQQITLSGSNLKGNITATAPSGFEISLNPNSGYASTLTINQSAGAVSNTTIYVRSSATAPTGNIAGSITLTSLSATNQTVAVSGVVNALPAINPVSNQKLNNGQVTMAVNFTGTGGFTWTNDTPGVGLAASGSGNIASFQAVNSGSTPITATVTVTAKSPGYAYIVGGGTTGKVYVVNTATQSVVATVPVGSQPFGVAFSPSGDKVYVTNGLSDYVSVIDAKTNKVVDTMYVGPNSVSICISPDGNTLYVGYAHGIVVINTITGLQITKILDQSLEQIIMSPDGQTVYAANYITDEVELINTATNTIIRRIDVGFNPNMLVLSPDGKTIYVTAMGNVRGIVAVVDLATSTLIASIPLGARPDGITVTPDGKKLYVTEEDSDKVAVVNTATNQIEKTIAVGSYPQGVSLTNDGSELYVNNVNSNDVSVINTATDQVINTIANLQLPTDIGNFFAPGPNCAGQPLKFTITVNPTPAQVPAITAGIPGGSISACQGTASISPQIQQFTVSGSNLAGDITATAPSGFEVSLSPGGGFGPNVKLIQTNGTVNNGIVYVRSSASAPAGDLNGTVVLTTTTTTQFVDVHGIVNALATISPVSNQVVANGATTAAVNFGGTGNSFSWTNDTPGIGIAASSTGDIPTFTAHNSGTTPIVATFTVTPEKDALAYITSASDGNVSVINTGTNKIIATIPVGNFPFGTAVSADGRVYVTNLTSNSMSVISTATNTVIATMPVPADPEGIAVSPDGNTVYVLSLATQVLSVIDTRTYTVTATLPVGQDTQYLALSPDGTKLFLANTAEFSLSVFDTKTNSITSTIPLTFPPYGIAAGVDNNTIYVDDSDNGKLVAVNASTKQVVASVAVGLEPRGVTVSPDGSRVYVGNTGENTVSVINMSTNAVIATLPVGLAPQGMSVTGDGKYVYVASQDASNVSVISNSTNTVVSTITVGSGPYSIGNFITPGIACPGPPSTFTITVNPGSSATPGITASVATGNISACLGTASASPQIQQFTVSGSNLPGDILASAPTVFEVSLSPNSGFSHFVTLKATGGVVNNTVIYVRSAATASAGVSSGNIDLTSGGFAGPSVPVTETINNLPSVNPLGNQKVNNGAPTTAVSFTGPGNAYTWVNDTPGIGLPASGTGDIGSFMAVNKGSSPVTATVTVTPTSSDVAYIANNTDGTISVVNTISGTIVTVIPVGSEPHGVVVSPGGSNVYVTNQFSNSVSVINTVSNTVSTTILVGNSPTCLALSPDGSVLYVTNQGDGTVSAINTATNTIAATFAAGTLPFAVAVSPDGTTLYVTNYNAGVVLVMSAVTHNIVATIPVGATPDGVSLSPDGHFLYVANSNTTYVSVINTSTNVATGTITTGIAGNLLVSADGARLYVADTGNGVITVVNTANNSLLTTIKTDRDPSFQSSNPLGLSMSADGSLLYATLNGVDSLAVISTATNTILYTIPVGGRPISQGNFIKAGTGCSGTPHQFTITVNPTSSAPAGITATSATGSNMACQGSASASPNIQQTVISGTNLTGAVSLTAPNGFEISLSAASGFGGSLTITPQAGAINNVAIYIRLSATAAAGSNSGNVEGTSPGATTIEITVTGVVNALSTVNPVSNQKVADGANTSAVNFTGTGDSFTWVNDSPSIGLQANGTGNIPAFTAVNTGSTTVVAKITVTPASKGYAYIPNGTSNTVSVINIATNVVEATIPVGTTPYGVAVTPDGSTVYVTNSGAGTVSVIDAATNTVIATIPVGVKPICVAVSPDGSTVYVANSGVSSVSVINTLTNGVTGTILLTGYSATGLSVSQDGKWLYVTAPNANAVIIVNTATNAILTTLTVGGTSAVFYVTTAPVGNNVYVAGSYGNSLLVFNSLKNTFSNSIPLDGDAVGCAVSPDGSRVYVTEEYSNLVTVVDATTNTVITTIPVGTSPEGIDVSPDGNSVYVANIGSNSVSIISTATNTVTNTVAVGQSPHAVGNFISAGKNCTGGPATFTITVTPATNPDITAGAATGNNSACQGTASNSPNIQQAIISGTNLTGAVSLTAPNNFEISLSATSGFGNTLSITPQGGAVSNVIVYIRLSATAPAGNSSGNVEGTSPGARTIEIPVTGTVNALPVVNPVPPQSVVNGGTTTAVNFAGTGNTFTWTNDTPGIGLPASGAGNISSFTAVNTGSTAVVATIKVTPAPTAFAYINNSGDGTVSVVNTSTNKIISIIAVGQTPIGIAVSPDGSRVYVENEDSNTISVINTASNTVVATIPAGPFARGGLVVSPDGTRLYLATFGGNNVEVINTITNAIIATIPVGDLPLGITISPDGTKVYVANFQGGTISVINTATNAVESSITVGPSGSAPFDVVISPDGSLLYVVAQAPDMVYVINAATHALVASLPIGLAADAIAISPDGSRVYALTQYGNTVTVINTASNQIIATVSVSQGPVGISVTPDGSQVYVTGPTGVSVISAASNTVTSTFLAGTSPHSFGNFIANGNGCAGQPIQFTITVNPTPTPPGGIAVSQANGSIIACQGTASTSPNIQQFIVSGTSLTAPIVLTAPNNFEISLSPGSGYTNTITLPVSAGTVNNTTIYVRVASTSPAGNISGNVSLTSTGVQSEKAPVIATVNAMPTVDAVAPQSFNNGATTTAINFSGSAANFTWTNDTPSIGLPASGSGDITPFTAVNTGTNPVIATITVTPAKTGLGCSGEPVTFTITVNPTLPVVITATGLLTGLTTVYGTPSPSESFDVSGTSLTSGILVAAPVGFELSTDNVNFSNTVTVGGGGNIPSQAVYIRLAAITPVGSYSGDIMLKSAGAADFTLAMPLSTVTPALLVIAADDKTKTFNTANPPLTDSFIGFVNNESVADLATPPVLSTTAVTNSPIGKYPIDVGGASSPNYTISYLPGTLTVLPTEQSLVIPNTFTPNGDGINDTWNIKYLDAYVNCSVDVFTRWGQKVYSSIGYGTPWDGTYKGRVLETGTYYYVINLKNGQSPLSGFVALIR